jgi:hypothetical protein
MCHPEMFHIFKANVFAKVKVAVPEISMEWLESQCDRLNLYWNAGESSETAWATIASFAKGSFSKTYTGREKTPLQMAILHRRF